MVEIDVLYQGDLRCEATHHPSSTIITTDAPKDNQGKGESFSPTDLIAAGLGTCMLTLMGITAKKMNLDLKGTKVSVKKDMVAQPLRRIGVLTIVIDVPLAPDETAKRRLIDAAMTCPVHESLHPDIHMPVEFRWAT